MKNPVCIQFCFWTLKLEKMSLSLFMQDVKLSWHSNLFPELNEEAGSKSMPKIIFSPAVSTTAELLLTIECDLFVLFYSAIYWIKMTKHNFFIIGMS